MEILLTLGGRTKDRAKDMKHFSMAVCLVVLASTTSCRHGSGKRISNGVYREPSGIESLAVNEEKIEFHIRIPNEQLPGVFTRTYTYGFETDTAFYVNGSSNDPVLVEGILRYNWFWDGTNILRKKHKTGETVIFAPVAAVQ